MAKLELNAAAQLEQVAGWMAMRTGLDKSKVMMVLQEMNEAILYFKGNLARPGPGGMARRGWLRDGGSAQNPPPN
ncbi:MAG: hypothetical protein V3S14_03100 [Anaerolineae bacterium]